MKKLTLLLTALLAVGLSSCQDLQDALATLKFSVTEVRLPLDGQPLVTFELDSQLPWTVIDCPTWITILPMAGVRGQVTVTVQADAIGASRSGTITIRASDGSRVSLPVSQLPLYYSFSIPSALLSISDNFNTAAEYAVYSGTRVFHVYDPADASTPVATRKRLAEICLEYINGFSTEIPAVVVYGIDPQTNGRLNQGVIANDGGTVDWSAGATLYSTPSTGATTTFYVNADGAILATPPVGIITAAAAAVGYTFRDWDYASATTDIEKALHEYPVVKIGKQYWIGKNLMTTTDANDAAITYDQGTTGWTSGTTASYAIHGNNTANKELYGLLYSYSSLTGLNSGGGDWRVATNAAWQDLGNYLGTKIEGDADWGKWSGGGLLKSVGTTLWTTPNQGATNVTGFTALPGGCRYDGGYCDDMGDYGDWWSASGGASGLANDFAYFLWDSGGVSSFGFSVRLFRDSI